MAKLKALSELMIDTTAAKTKTLQELSDNIDAHSYEVLMQAERHWVNLQSFREQRKRCIDYMFGKQWNDPSPTGHGTEGDYIVEQGSIPITNNLIHKLVKTVEGLYLGQNTEPICVTRDRDEQQTGEVLSELLGQVRDANDEENLEMVSFKDFLAGGFVGSYVDFYYNPKKGREDVWTRNINANNFIVDTSMEDFRGDDCNLIGMIRDYTFRELCTMFATKPEDVDRLQMLYQRSTLKESVYSTRRFFGAGEPENYNFFIPLDSSKCRVIEVWNIESAPRYRCFDPLKGEFFKIDLNDYDYMIEQENDLRRQQGIEAGMAEEEIPFIQATYFIDNFWYYRFFTPTGIVLREGETPYEHMSHPFAFRFYPFVNAEVHSFVGDVLDVQKYVNRLITLNDFIIRSSAKGVLMIPEQLLEGSDMTPEQFADEWTKFNGVIYYRAKAGIEPPRQITANTSNANIDKILQMELSFIDEVTGVNAAMQGKSVGAVSGTYYAQQAQNSATTIGGILKCYNSYVKEKSKKEVQLIQQYYEGERVVHISGTNARTVVLSPSLIKDVDFDLSIADSPASPVYRDAMNNFLMQLFGQGALPLEVLLKNSNVPYADKILQDLNNYNDQQRQMQMEQAQAQAQAQGQPPAELPQEEAMTPEEQLAIPDMPPTDADSQQELLQEKLSEMTN